MSDADRDRQLQRRHGITLDDYNRMLAGQHGRCAICERKPGKRALCVDHEHKTGRLRGLLCSRCNQALGKLNDNHKTLQNAEAYLAVIEEPFTIPTDAVAALADLVA